MATKEVIHFPDGRTILRVVPVKTWQICDGGTIEGRIRYNNKSLRVWLDDESQEWHLYAHAIVVHQDGTFSSILLTYD